MDYPVSDANPFLNGAAMDEQELVSALTQAEREYKLAKDKLAQAKKVWTAAETVVIESKLVRDRAQDALRAYRAITPDHILDEQEREIVEYRERCPEMVQFAKERDNK